VKETIISEAMAQTWEETSTQFPKRNQQNAEAIMKEFCNGLEFI